MAAFAGTLDAQRPLSVLDVGAFDVNGSYRPLFPTPWTYTGLDIEAGPNVDVVALAPYRWQVDQFDVVVSGQAAEHVPDLRAWAMELGRHVKPAGRVCLIAPWQWDPHPYPVDCWRILPDGMEWLLLTAVLVPDEIRLDGRDCIGIAHNPRTP